MIPHKKRKNLRKRSIKASRKRGEWPLLRFQVYERDAARCVLCAQSITPSNLEVHHRVRRSQGGRDVPENLISLHGSSCHRKVHDNPAWSYEHGFLLKSGQDPASSPVFRYMESWMQPTANHWDHVEGAA